MNGTAEIDRLVAVANRLTLERNAARDRIVLLEKVAEAAEAFAAGYDTEFNDAPQEERAFAALAVALAALYGDPS